MLILCRCLPAVLAGMLLMTGCTRLGAKDQETAPKPPAPDSVSREPVPLLKGPIYLLSEPENPLWPGWAAVSIENSQEARPQSGLTQADLVVEALAEGTITRFTAYFRSQAVDVIGPVRSARQYTLAQARAYGAPFAHAGGSMEALAMARSDDAIMDLDEIYGGVVWGFWRASDRTAPHNLYTSTARIDQMMEVLGYTPRSVPTTPKVKGLLPEGNFVSRVDVNWSGPNQIAWIWDEETGAYQRFIGDEPHPTTEVQGIYVPNLVFLEVAGTYRGPDEGWYLDLARGGLAAVVVAGYEWEGRWELVEGEGFRLIPTDGAAAPPFQPGQVWTHLITASSSYALSYREIEGQ